MKNCDKCNFNTCDECAFKEKSISERFDDKFPNKILEERTYRDGVTIRVGIKKEIKQFFKQQIEEIFKEIEEPSYIGVMDSNEKRRGYEIAIKEILLLKKKYLI